MINPLIVEGQIHGGVAHGIGNAFYEQLVYDERASSLNASFMDYLLPTALDVPRVEIGASRDAVAAQSARASRAWARRGASRPARLFAQAVEDALGRREIEILRDSAESRTGCSS